jgi:hypothetical protein
MPLSAQLDIDVFDTIPTVHPASCSALTRECSSALSKPGETNQTTLSFSAPLLHMLVGTAVRNASCVDPCTGEVIGVDEDLDVDVALGGGGAQRLFQSRTAGLEQRKLDVVARPGRIDDRLPGAEDEFATVSLARHVEARTGRCGSPGIGKPFAPEHQSAPAPVRSRTPRSRSGR